MGWVGGGQDAVRGTSVLGLFAAVAATLTGRFTVVNVAWRHPNAGSCLPVCQRRVALARLCHVNVVPSHDNVLGHHVEER